MSIIIEEIVVNPLIQIEETIEEITIPISEMQMPGPQGIQGIQGLKGEQGIQGAPGSGVKITPWIAGTYASGDQVNHLGKDWVSNAATVAGDVPGTSAKWNVRLTAYENKANLIVGKNVFNKATALIGYYLDRNNYLAVSATYDVSDFIPVTPGQIFKSNYNLRFTTYFDNNKLNVAGGSNDSLSSFTIPAGVYFIRVSISHTDINIFQLELGTVSTAFEAYKLVIDNSQFRDNFLSGEKVLDNSLSGEKIIDNSLIERKTTFFDTSKNLFNPNDVDVKLGFYVNGLNGTTPANASYNASGFIPVTALQQYTMSCKHQIAWYDSSKVFISGSLSADTNKTQTAPAGSAYLRCTIPVSLYSTFQVEAGAVQTAYAPYGYALKEKYITKQLEKIGLDKYESILGEEGKILSQSNLTDASIIEITDFPLHLKKGISMSIYADLSLVGTVSYGKGYGKYRGEYYTIDNTNIYQYNDSVLVTTKAHGLVISTFIKSSFSVDDNGVANFILQSLTGYYKTTFQMLSEMNYEPFIRTGGQSLSNIKLTITCKDFRHPVWAFGDSYFGIGRWPGSMKTFGYFNFLINGLAGQSSPGAYADLLKCLNYGTPKYIIWCLGMNDADASYIETLNLLKSLCDSKNIKLILSTVPTVPSRNKEVIKTTVLTSGNRYIDFYKAVGANNAGMWYSGYLSADKVHPNQVGADALATQVLIDFPELMQYGKNL